MAGALLEPWAERSGVESVESTSKRCPDIFRSELSLQLVQGYFHVVSIATFDYRKDGMVVKKKFGS